LHKCIVLILAVMVMSMTTAQAGLRSPEIPREQLLEDQTYAIETVQALANAIAPNMPWVESLFPNLGCLAPDGRIKGYQTSFSLDLWAKRVGHNIDDAKAIDSARSWLDGRGFQFVLDEHHTDGLRQLRAVKEDDTDGIGISINAHPGVVGIKGTTKCRP